MTYTKAGMLKELYKNVSSVNVLPAFVVMCDDFLHDSQGVVNAILEFAPGKELIVRSSSKMEDSAEYSNAATLSGGFSVFRLCLSDE